MDGQMSEDIRIGIAVRTEMWRACTGSWRRKDGTGTPMSFSSYLLFVAGGIRALLRDWEPDPADLLTKEAAR